MKRELIAIAFVIVALVAAVYVRNVENEFSRLDDYTYIVENEHIRHGLTGETLRWAFSNDSYASNWHPLTWISHAADVAVANAVDWDWLADPNRRGLRRAKLTGSFARFVHAENIVLHSTNAVLLFLLIFVLLRRMRFDVGCRVVVVAGVCALLWAIHPLRVEVVAWASERKELLSVFFMLVSLLAYLRKGAFPISLACYALALLAKPVAVGLPAVLFGLDVLLMRKDAKRRDWCVTALRVLPFAVMAAGACALTLAAQTKAMRQGDDFSPLVRLVCAVEAPVIYLRQTFWPFDLSISYMMPTGIGSAYFFVGVALIVAIIATSCAWLAMTLRGKVMTFGWRLVPLAIGWCYVCLIPMLGIVKVGYQPHSDRYTYWVGCGVAALFAIGLLKTEAYWRPFTRRMAIVGIVLLLLSSTASLTRSSFWQRSLTLFTDAVRSAHLEEDAWVLSVLLVSEYPKDKGAMAEEMLREVLSVRKSAHARAILAHLLASCRGPETRVNAVTGRTESFGEARLLAVYALDEPERSRHDLAWAALGFIEYRLGNYQQAYENFKNASDLGYDFADDAFDIEDLRRKAAAEAANVDKERN